MKRYFALFLLLAVLSGCDVQPPSQTVKLPTQEQTQTNPETAETERPAPTDVPQTAPPTEPTEPATEPTPAQEDPVQMEQVPPYFEEQLATVISNVQGDMDHVAGHGETFLFITDLHYSPYASGNQRHSAALMNQILRCTDVRNAICGGDLINEGEYQQMRQVMMECVDDLMALPVPVPIVFGNHDDNKNNQSSQENSDRWFSQEEVYAMFYAPLGDFLTFVSGGIENTWYYDRMDTKTRFIGFDTGNAMDRKPEYQYLVSALESVPAGWHVIVIPHMFHQSGKFNGIGKNIAKILDQYNAGSGTVTVGETTYTFTPETAEGHVELIIGGHAHYDAETTTDGGIPAIVTDTDGSHTATKDQNGEKDYAAGTITEQCFDVVTVDYDTGTVTCRRVGRGQDRIIGG